MNCFEVNVLCNRRTLSSNTQETMGFSSGLTMNYPWLHVMDDDAEEFVEGDSLILRVTRVMYWVLFFIIGVPIRF